MDRIYFYLLSDQTGLSDNQRWNLKFRQSKTFTFVVYEKYLSDNSETEDLSVKPELIYLKYYISA